MADGRECKLVTDPIDDHSRFVVIATAVNEPSARTMCTAFITGMARYGVPSEGLTDNGKQFTGRFTKPYPAEVLFERDLPGKRHHHPLDQTALTDDNRQDRCWHKNLHRDLLDAAGTLPRPPRLRSTRGCTATTTPGAPSVAGHGHAGRG